MEWEKTAEQAIRKVPFFVRKKVRARVEKDAGAAGKTRVSLSDVEETRKRYLNKMDSEIKGYQLDACFGSGGCPNRIMNSELRDKIENLLKRENLLGFLRKTVTGGLKFHHEFRITVSDCPNACSQPQIKDIGIIGAETPCITDNKCIACMECVTVCKENAISVDETDTPPTIDFQLCVQCGQCIAGCPAGSIDTDRVGYRVMLGGKLGRHPRLAEELPEVYSETDVLKIIRQCLQYYKANSKNGERFAQLVARDNKFVPGLIR
jgi:anaerobic sulfite reductase subunit C